MTQKEAMTLWGGKMKADILDYLAIQQVCA